MSSTDADAPFPHTGTRRSGLDLDNAGFVTELTGLSSFLEQQTSLEQSLKELAAMAARLLTTGNCSIMLLKDDPDNPDGPRLRVATHHGHLPAVAYQESVKLNEGIAGRVVSTGRPILIQEINDSDYATQARRKTPAGGFVSAPIRVDEHVVGVLNISDPTDNRILGTADLNLAGIVALVVGKSIQVHQLQHLLRSNFIQLALARETRDMPWHTTRQIAQHGGRMAPILAKSFFNEMRQAGFGTDHILSAATEIISLLNTDLGKRPDAE